MLMLRNHYKPFAAALVGVLAGIALVAALGADYGKGTLGTAGTIGTPTLALRRDTAADDAGANLALARLSLDAFGALRISAEGGKPTYTATSQFACDSTATDIAIFQGVATKTIKLLGVYISTTATAAATGDVTIIRRTAADTAGTSAAAGLGQLDPADVAPAAAPIHYTAHPTALGASAAPGGKLFGLRMVQQAAGTPQATSSYIDFKAGYGGKACRISGTTDFVAVNVAAALGGSGNAWDVTWIWLEGPTTE